MAGRLQAKVPFGRYALAVLACLLAATGCKLEQFPQSTMDPRSDYAWAIQRLLDQQVFWVVVIFVIVLVAQLFILVRFRARSLDGNGSGWDAYSRYSKGDMPLLKRVGGTVLWAGTVEGVSVGDLGDGRWDWVVLVLYPSRASFLEMMTSTEYAAINVDRENGVEEHVILVANQTYSKLAGRPAPA